MRNSTWLTLLAIVVLADDGGRPLFASDPQLTAGTDRLETQKGTASNGAGNNPRDLQDAMLTDGHSLVSVQALNPPSVSLIPVSADAPPEASPPAVGWSISGNEITLAEADRVVWLEVRIGDWDPDDTGVQLLSSYISLDFDPVSIFLNDVLTPYQPPCTSDAECQAALGPGATCNPWPISGCSPGFIDRNRNDYVYLGTDHISDVIFDHTIDFVGNLFFDSPLDDPEPFPAEGLYAGMLVLQVPPDARGTFTISMREFPSTQLVDQLPQFILPLVVIPAKITVEVGDDCNANGIPDQQDIADGTSEDCNENGIPDECDLADGTSFDCDDTNIPDECEWKCFDQCNGADLALVPVSADGPSLILGNEIRVEPGTRVFLELRLGGWDPEPVNEYRLTIDSSGYSNGLAGSLAPAGEPCESDTDCVAAFGAGATCNDPFGAGVKCTAGFIDTERADLAFSVSSTPS